MRRHYHLQRVVHQRGHVHQMPKQRVMECESIVIDSWKHLAENQTNAKAVIR